ncbi:MAG: C4-type zinc ribbon domain-containing protein [Aeromicrobium sp.]|uniref:zinc ribbon domain-containing protein n=1 Tax=Aeromicrobium sp. TaxID=1871063 RepID=UPI0039E5712E
MDDDAHHPRPCPPSIREPPLKAAPHDQLTLLDLADRDARLGQLAHRRRALPELAVLTEAVADEARLNDRRIELDTLLGDLRRELRQAEAEVEQVRARRDRDEQRLSSGAITNPKDLTNLEHEMQALQRRITTLEDNELEVMDRVETTEADLSGVMAELERARAKVADVTAARDAAFADLDAERDRVAAERADLAARLGEPLLATYEKVRAQYGSGAAALRARRCEGCRLEINGADLREIAGLPDDEVVRCPECSRILVRTIESGL